MSGFKLTGVERDMAKAYVEVHSRKINECMRQAEKGPPSNAHLGPHWALQEARGVVAALERLAEREENG